MLDGAPAICVREAIAIRAVYSPQSTPTKWRECTSILYVRLIVVINGFVGARAKWRTPHIYPFARALAVKTLDQESPFRVRSISYSLPKFLRSIHVSNRSLLQPGCRTTIHHTQHIRQHNKICERINHFNQSPQTRRVETMCPTHWNGNIILCFRCADSIRCKYIVFFWFCMAFAYLRCVLINHTLFGLCCAAVEFELMRPDRYEKSAEELWSWILFCAFQANSEGNWARILNSADYN